MPVLLSLVVLFISTLGLPVFTPSNPSAQSSEFGLTLGYRTDGADSRYTNLRVNSSGNFQGGVIGLVDFSKNLNLRGGFLYTRRAFNISADDLSGVYNLTYMDIPLSLLVRFNEYGGLMGGLVLSMNASKDCSLTSYCTPSGTQSLLLGYQIGTHFKFAPQQALELYFEMLPGRLTSDIENARAVVLSYIFFAD